MYCSGVEWAATAAESLTSAAPELLLLLLGETITTPRLTPARAPARGNARLLALLLSF